MSINTELKKMTTAISIGRDCSGYLNRRAQSEGSSFWLEMPGLNRVLMMASADGSREVFQADPRVLTSTTPSPLDPILGVYSLILQQGENHSSERKLLQPMFQGTCLRSYVPMMESIILEKLEKVRGVTDVPALMDDITLSVIIRVVFGVVDKNQVEIFRAAVEKLISTYSPALMLVPQLRRSITPFSPWSRFLQAKQQLDNLLLQQIDQRRRTLEADDKGSDDLASHLVNARDENGLPLSDEHIRDELTTMLVAGHETTANSLNWACYFLTEYPEIQAKVKASVETLEGKATIEKIMKLEYFDAFCKEVLRFHPVVPVIFRSVLQDTIIAGQPVEKGGYVGIATPVLHRSKSYWKDPDAFNPENFLEKKPSPFEYVPFGGGNKKCIGFGFALFELKLVLFHLIKNFTLYECSQKALKPKIKGIVMGQNRKLHVNFSKVTVVKV